MIEHHRQEHGDDGYQGYRADQAAARAFSELQLFFANQFRHVGPEFLPALPLPHHRGNGKKRSENNYFIIIGRQITGGMPGCGNI